MCFSATASFVSGSLLVPVGLHTLDLARRRDRRYLPLATFPLLFGIQQLIEGGLWLSLAGPTWFGTTAAALGFLAFAYFLWPALVPFAACSIEERAGRRRVFAVLAVAGFLFGASLYLPLLLNPEWISVTISGGSILYRPALIYDGHLPREAVRIVYAVIVSAPLLFSSVGSVRGFGGLVVLSVIGSAIVFAHAFVSVWCYFAAILSLAVVVIVWRIPAAERGGYRVGTITGQHSS